MSDFSIFQSREWAEYWGPKEQQNLAALESAYRRGSDGVRATDKSDPAHWQFSKLKYNASREKLDLHMGMFGKRYSQNSHEYKDALFMYRKNKPGLEQLLENIQKMENRFQQRDDILELAKSDHKPEAREKIMNLLVTFPGDPDGDDAKELEQNVKRMYGHKTDDDETEIVWDPVRGDWSVVTDMKVIHLTPYTLDPQLVAYLFGPTFKRDINIADNGLYLPTAVEEAYRNYRLTIVPSVGGHSPEKCPVEWKFLVVDPTVGDKIACNTTTFNDLHGRNLSFKPGHHIRPRARFPYLHYSFALVHFIRNAKGVGARDPDAPEVKAVPALLNAWAPEKAHLADNCQTMVDEELMRAKQKMWEE